MTSSEVDDPASAAAVISAEQLGEVRRWQLPDFDPPPPPPPPRPSNPEPEVEAPRLPTAEDIERIERAARDEGYERGLQEGRNTGYETGLEQAREQARQLAALCEHLAAPLAALDEVMERQLLALCLELAERILQRQLQLQPEFVETVVRGALEVLGRSESPVCIHVHPEDLEVLELLGFDRGEKPWRLQADPNLRRGGCRLETDHGQVDASLETRLVEVRRQLLGEALP